MRPPGLFTLPNENAGDAVNLAHRLAVDALSALDAGRLVIDEGSFSRGWGEVFPGLSEDDRRLGGIVTSYKSAEPKPISRCLPCIRNMNTQLFAPDFETFRYKFPPSEWRPGCVVVAPLLAESLCNAAMIHTLP